MAAAGGDFTVLSNTVATRDAALPAAELLGQLRSATLHAWQPPRGGAAGALSHAVIHSLDVTIAVDQPAVALLGGRTLPDGRSLRSAQRRPDAGSGAHPAEASTG